MPTNRRQTEERGCSGHRRTVYFKPLQDVQISTQASRSQYQYTLVSTDPTEVSIWATKMGEALKASPVLRDVASEASDGGLAARIDIDRDTAGRLGVTMQAISDALNNAFGQRQVSTIFAQANQYRVVLETKRDDQNDPHAWRACTFHRRRGRRFP